MLPWKQKEPPFILFRRTESWGTDPLHHCRWLSNNLSKIGITFIRNIGTSISSSNFPQSVCSFIPCSQCLLQIWNLGFNGFAICILSKTSPLTVRLSIKWKYKHSCSFLEILWRYWGTHLYGKYEDVLDNVLLHRRESLGALVPFRVFSSNPSDFILRTYLQSSSPLSLHSTVPLYLESEGKTSHMTLK